jgi:hypothetical protein
MRDQFVDIPKRAVVGGARQTAKAVLLKTSGGEGLERARLAVARLRRRSFD